jgi:hypothetical protein
VSRARVFAARRRRPSWLISLVIPFVSRCCICCASACSVGRTGRAGNKGTAITFITPDEDKYAADLVKALTDAKQVSGATPRDASQPQPPRTISPQPLPPFVSPTTIVPHHSSLNSSLRLS